MNRSLRHLALALASAAAALAAAAAAPEASVLDRLSLTTAWVCAALFTATLLVGPVHVLRAGRPPGNSLLRRDLGIWCALNGLAHLGLAFENSMNAAYVQAYVYGATVWPSPVARLTLYSASVIASLVVAALFALLLALSSNRALRRLGPVWWKRLQRASYPAFALTVAHGFAFQLLELRTPWLVVALAVLTAVVLAAQLAGWRRLSLRGRRSPASAPGTR